MKRIDAKDLRLCEKDNTLLVNDDCMEAWLQIQMGAFLEISYQPGRSPALMTGVVELSEAELAKHINEHCIDWEVKQCNIDGVHVSLDRYVVGN